MESKFFYVYVYFFLIFTYYFFLKKRVAVTNFHNGKKKAKYAPEAPFSDFKFVPHDNKYKHFLKHGSQTQIDFDSTRRYKRLSGRLNKWF